jgi:hypothetical protein
MNFGAVSFLTAKGTIDFGKLQVLIWFSLTVMLAMV